MEVGTEVLVQLIDGTPRVQIGTVTEAGFDLIHGEVFIRIDDGPRVFESDVFGVRTL